MIKPSAPRGPAYSLVAFREAFRRHDPVIWQVLQPRIQACIREQLAAGNYSLHDLNRRALKVCNQVFPPTLGSARPKPDHAPVQQFKVGIRRMWELRGRFRAAQREAAGSRSLVVWREYESFMQQCRDLKRQCRRARRHKFEHYIDLAHQASLRNDASEVYRIARLLLAPKQQRIHAAIRSPEGHLLSQADQFAALMKYFGNAYTRTDEFDPGPASLSFALEQAEVVEAVGSLIKAGKAEMWQLCKADYGERSSMLFGQHVCYKLETADATALRAIAKSPSFITHEATSTPCTWVLIPLAMP